MNNTEIITNLYPGAVLFNNMDEAIVGIHENTDNEIVAVYSIEKCIAILMTDMDREEANLFFEANMRDASELERGPIFIRSVV